MSAFTLCQRRAPAGGTRLQQTRVAKVFWSFFSKKDCLLAFSCRWPAATSPDHAGRHSDNHPRHTGRAGKRRERDDRGDRPRGQRAGGLADDRRRADRADHTQPERRGERGKLAERRGGAERGCSDLQGGDGRLSVQLGRQRVLHPHGQPDHPGPFQPRHAECAVRTALRRAVQPACLFGPAQSARRDRVSDAGRASGAAGAGGRPWRVAVVQGRPARRRHRREGDRIVRAGSRHTCQRQRGRRDDRRVGRHRVSRTVGHTRRHDQRRRPAAALHGMWRPILRPAASRPWPWRPCRAAW